MLEHNQAQIMQIIQAVNGYRDRFNLLVKKDKDGGDTAHTTGVYYSILAYLKVDQLEAFHVDASNLANARGRYVRHPDSKKWYSNPNNFTRDQNNPLVSAFILSSVLEPEFKQDVLQVVEARKKVYFMHFNTESGDEKTGTIKNRIADPPAPVEFGLYASVGALNVPWQYITDIQLIFDVTIGLRLNTWDSVAGLTPILLARNAVKPTIWSKIALYLFRKQKTYCMEQITRYYGEQNGNNGLQPLVDLFSFLFAKLNGRQNG